MASYAACCMTYAPFALMHAAHGACTHASLLGTLHQTRHGIITCALNTCCISSVVIVRWSPSGCNTNDCRSGNDRYLSIAAMDEEHDLSCSLFNGWSSRLTLHCITTPCLIQAEKNIRSPITASPPSCSLVAYSQALSMLRGIIQCNLCLHIPAIRQPDGPDLVACHSHLTNLRLLPDLSLLLSTV